MINKYLIILIILLSNNFAITTYSNNSIFSISNNPRKNSMGNSHSLSKNISPGKTIEGSLGGIIITSFLSLAIIKWNISPFYLDDANIFYITFSIILLSIFGQIGDLFFSKIKRIKKIKDFGNIFPGHGGVLDRIDSSLFIFILGYFILLKWINL